jgi:hypothetical protein
VTLKEALEWYAYLAKTPGWKAYVWERVKEMARENPELYWKLPDLLIEEMQRDD